MSDAAVRSSKSPGEGADPDPLLLVPTTDSRRGTPSSELSARLRDVEEGFRLETAAGQAKRTGLFWRNSGGVAVVVEIANRH